MPGYIKHKFILYLSLGWSGTNTNKDKLNIHFIIIVKSPARISSIFETLKILCFIWKLISKMIFFNKTKSHAWFFNTEYVEKYVN